MHRHYVSVTIEDDEIWEQRRARLKALESVNKPHHQAEFKRRVYPLQRTAAKEGNVDKFIEALEKYSAEERGSLSDIIHIQGPSGNSLLHVAAGVDKADILRALLEIIRDKRLAATANYRGDTPLHVAARAGRICTAELLLGCGRIVDMANDAGNTALHEAVKHCHYELTCLLLSRGSRSVYLENEESKCPLYLAVQTGDLKILGLLMEAMDGNEVLCVGENFLECFEADKTFPSVSSENLQTFPSKSEDLRIAKLKTQSLSLLTVSRPSKKTYLELDVSSRI